MSKRYIVVRSFYEGNGLHEVGNPFEHDDKELIEKELADGNIEEVAEGGSESKTPLVTPPADSDLPNPETTQQDNPTTPGEQTQPQQPTASQIEEDLELENQAPSASDENKSEGNEPVVVQ